MQKKLARSRIILAVFVYILSPACYSKKPSFNSMIGLETRLFTESAELGTNNQSSFHNYLSFSHEIFYKREKNSFFVDIYGNRDFSESGRTYLDIREGFYQNIREGFDITVGISHVFWGVAESVHLVDVINQTDASGDITGEDKLGQPMVRINLFKDWGDVSIYLLPYFRTRNYPSSPGRLSTNLPISKNPTFEAKEKEKHVDYALRFQNYFGNFDIGFSYFRGTSREPMLSVQAESIDVDYFQINRAGLDVQYTAQSLLYKLEVIGQRRYSKSFFAAVVGIENTLYGIFKAHDLGLLAEYQWDERDNKILPRVSSQNDLFVGLRYTFNNAQDSALLAGGLYDIDDKTIVYSVEAETRITQNLRAKMNAHFFTNVSENNLLRPFYRDDFVSIKIERFF